MGHRILFLFRLTYKNIIRYRLRGILMFFSFMVLLTTLFLGLSMPGFTKVYYTSGPVSTYGPYDLMVGVNPNGNTRYFSLRPLLEAETEEVIEAFVPFFEVETMANNASGTRSYVKTMASTLDALRSITDGIPDDMTTLDEDGVIITTSLAQKMALDIGSSLSVSVGENGADYVVRLVIDDHRLFFGDTIFINKAGSIRLFIRAISPDIAGLPDLFFTNIYNRIYLASVSGKQEAALSLLTSLPEYQSLDIEETINMTAITQLVRRSTSVFNVIFWIMVATVLFVMQTTFLLFFEEKRRTFAITSLIGGNPGFSYLTVIMEISFYFILALLMAMRLTQIVFDYGIRATGRNFPFAVSSETIMTGIIITIIVFLVVSGLNLMKMRGDQLIRLSKDESGDRRSQLTGSLVIFIASGLIYLLLRHVYIFDAGVLGEAILIFAMTLVLLKVVAFLVSKVLRRTRRKPLLGLFMTVTISKKAFSRWLSVMTISVLSIFLLVQTHSHVSGKIARIEDEQIIDFALLNLMTRYDQIATDIALRDDVMTSDKATVLENVVVSESDENLAWMFSIESDRINDYFTFAFQENSLEELRQDERLVVLLPLRYHDLLGYDIGETILFDLSPADLAVPMTIVGFFEKEIGDTAFSNLRKFDVFDDVSDNAILINAKGDKEALKNSLIDHYASSLVYVLDFEDIFLSRQHEIESVLGYVTLVLSVMIGCFVLSVIVHTLLLFEAMKDNIRKLMVLGLSATKAYVLIFFEKTVFMILVIVVASGSLLMIVGLVPRLVIYFNDYEKMLFSPIALTSGIAISLLVYGSSLLIDFLMLKKTRFTNVIRL